MYGSPNGLLPLEAVIQPNRGEFSLTDEMVQNLSQALDRDAARQKAAEDAKPPDQKVLEELAANRPTLDALGQRVAIDKLHHQEVPAVGLLHSIQRRDVGMIQRGEQFRLAFESRNPFRILSERFGQHPSRAFCRPNKKGPGLSVSRSPERKPACKLLPRLAIHSVSTGSR